MKKYNFDELVDRKSTNSYKWDIKDDTIPLWVADMDFETAPNVKEAIENRAKHGIYGYSVVTDEWYQAYMSWWKRRHNVDIEKDWLIYCSGVVPAITSSIKRISNVGDNVLVFTPVYDIFFHSIENTGRHVVEHSLYHPNKDEDRADILYKLDLHFLEEQLSDPLTTVLLLCNPHNPVGLIWEDYELKYILDLCKKYNVTVICDEIHCDLVAPGYKYNSILKFAKEYENMIVCLSASKAFNIAGLQSAAVVIPDKHLNDIVNRGLNSDELAEPNAFAIDATVAALSEQSEEWLNELNEYIWLNREIVGSLLIVKFNLRPIISHATYLLWVDCGFPTRKLVDYIYNQFGVLVSSGMQYRGFLSENFIRINLACPEKLLKEAISRLDNCFDEYSKIEFDC